MLDSSSGHLGLLTHEDGTVFEIFLQAAPATAETRVMKAPMDDVLRVDTRQRAGRWLCDLPAWLRYGPDVVLGPGFEPVAA